MRVFLRDVRPLYMSDEKQDADNNVLCSTIPVEADEIVLWRYGSTNRKVGGLRNIRIGKWVGCP